MIYLEDIVYPGGYKGQINPTKPRSLAPFGWQVCEFAWCEPAM